MMRTHIKTPPQLSANHKQRGSAVENRIPDDQRLNQYCERHDLHFMGFLPHCPICRGEALGKIRGSMKLNIDFERIPNKRGLPWGVTAKSSPAVESSLVEAQKGAVLQDGNQRRKAAKPVQMSLFG